MQKTWSFTPYARYVLIVMMSTWMVSVFAQNPKPPAPDNLSEERLAMQYFQQRDYEKSISILERLFKDQKKPHLYSYYFIALTELKKYDDAGKIARQMQKQFPGQVAWEVDEAYVKYLEGESRKADRQFESIIEKSATNQQSVLQTANAFRSRNLTSQALATYEKGRKLLNDPNAFLLEIASVYEVAGDFRNSVDTYITLLMSNGSSLENIKGRLQFSLAQDIDDERSAYLKQKLLGTLQKNSDNRELAELLLWFSLQQKDFPTALTQARALNARFGTNGQEILQFASIASSNGDPATAIEALDYLIKRYPNSPLEQQARLQRLDVQFDLFLRSAAPSATETAYFETEIRQTIAQIKGQETVNRLTRYLAHLLAFYLDRTEESIGLLEGVVNTGIKVSAEKLELADIYLYAGNIWDANLLYAQVDKEMREEELGQEARFRQARLSYYIGEFEWSKTQLDVLKSATSRLIANDAMELSLLISDNIDPDSTYTTLQRYARADMLAYRKKFVPALALLDSIAGGNLGHPIHDEVLLKKANIYETLGQLPLADSLYERLYTFFPEGIWADKALINRARLLDHKLNTPLEALPVYENLIIRFGSSFYADEARRRLREIRQTKPITPAS